MVEPLRKRRPNGALYQRRAAVDRELQNLDKLNLADVVARARTAAPHGKHAVSSEALVHILRREVRTACADGPNSGSIDALTSILTKRYLKILTRKLAGYDEIDRQAIVAEMTDRVIDAIVDDRDLDDYAEVNFNDWLMHRWLDVYRKHKRKAQRTERLGDAVEDLSDDEAQLVHAGEEGQDHNTPEALCALNEAREKAKLPPQIDSANLSAKDRYRIAEMVRKADLPPDILYAFLAHYYLEMQIDSNDSEQHTLVKHFGKSEKTIRLWIKRAEKAFTELREAKHENKQIDASKPRRGAARLSR